MATDDSSTPTAGSDASGETAADNCDDGHKFPPDAALPSVLSLFGKKHTLAIMYEFAFSDDPLRFGDLESRLDISSTTLSERLGELVERGYVTRESYDEIPPRVEYESTEKTHELTPIFEDLYDWAQAHASADTDS